MAAVAEEAAKGGGGFHPVQLLTTATEASITGLHDLLSSMGVPSAYGISIICFTLFVKAITFPLTYQQLASTTKMQTLGPKVRKLTLCDAYPIARRNGVLTEARSGGGVFATMTGCGIRALAEMSRTQQ